MNWNYNDPMKTQKQVQRDPTQTIHPRRPFLITLLLWAFGLWSLLGWLRYGRALLERSLILEVFASSVFWYLLLAGLISGLAAMPVLWGLVRGAPWTPALVWVMSIVYPFYYWAERLFLWSDPYADDNWLFILFLTLLWFGLVTWAMRSPRSKRFFLQVDEE